MSSTRLAVTGRTPPRQSRIPSSAYKMGLFALVCISLMGLLAMLIGNLSFADRRGFRASFTDVTGVNVGDRVRLSGVEVGRVTGVDLTGDGTRATVSFDVDHDVPIYRSAQLVLRYENIVGQRYLEIHERPGAGDEMPTGGTFGLDHTTPALNLTVLFNGFQPLFRALQPQQVNRLSALMVDALQGEGDTYQQLLASTADLTDTLADKDEVIGRVVDNLGSVLRTIDDRDTKLTGLIVSFRKLMGGLAGDSGRLSATLPGLSDLLTVSTGYLADVRGPLKDVVTGLDAAAGQLDRSRSELDRSLKRLPFRMLQQARTAGYGSAFNYYLCGISANLRLLGSDYLLQTPSLSANERDTVCARHSVADAGLPAQDEGGD